MRHRRYAFPGQVKGLAGCTCNEAIIALGGINCDTCYREQVRQQRQEKERARYLRRKAA